MLDVRRKEYLRLGVTCDYPKGRQGEHIVTEYSYKYTVAGVCRTCGPFGMDRQKALDRRSKAVQRAVSGSPMTDKFYPFPKSVGDTSGQCALTFVELLKSIPHGRTANGSADGGASSAGFLLSSPGRR